MRRAPATVDSLSMTASAAAVASVRDVSKTFGARKALNGVSIEVAAGEMVALIVKRGSGLTLADVLACGQRYRFGAGDPQSTSGTLVPMTFLFNPRGIQPEVCFRTVRPGNHESNALEVAAVTVYRARPKPGTAVGPRRPHRCRKSRIAPR